jgi:hypothetical protein
MVRLQTLQTQFQTLKIYDFDSVDLFMKKVIGIVNQLHINGEEIADQTIVEKVLRSLPKKYEMVVTAILESNDLSNFSVDALT